MANVEVLLRRSVESVGRVGEVVRVKPGFARNYLFPHGLAVLPSKENLRLVEKDKAVEVALEAEAAKVRADLIAKLAGVSVSIEVKSNPEGHLFGSVGAKQVADALVAKGHKVEDKHVRLEPIKQLGEYEVTIHLAADAETKIKLWVLDEVTKLASKAVAEAPKPEPEAPARGGKGGKGARGDAAKGEKAADEAPPAKAPAKAEKAPAKGEKKPAK